MNIQWKNLITCLAIPLAVGSLSALLTRNSMETFNAVTKPGLAPPGWLFPVVWTILYILMGIASYLVLTSGKPNDKALAVYTIQLIFNFFWSIIFFNFHFYLFAFIWLILLWLLILKTALLFHQIVKPAGYLMIPYLLWVTFAGYLNFFIYLLNDVGVKRFFAPFDTELLRTLCSRNSQKHSKSALIGLLFHVFGGSQGQKSSCKQACIGFSTF